MDPITIRVVGIPKPQPRARSFALRGKGGRVIMTQTGQPIIRAYESGTAENWKSEIALAAKEFVPMPPLQGPIRVDVEFIFPRPKAHFRANGELKPGMPYFHTGKVDRDNLDKAVLDCLTTIGMWCDDGQVCAGELTKRYAAFGEKPGAVIDIAVLVEAGQQHMQPPSVELQLTNGQ